MSIAIEGGMILVLAGVAAVAIALVVKAVTGRTRGGADDARLIQEVYQGLERLERRVEALETILSDRRQRERNA